MRLDYSVPSFQLLIGSFNATDYLDAIVVSAPHFELNQPLIWTGRFALSYNRKAAQLGLTEAEFSELDKPERWRPGQTLVRLKIKGYDLPALRIEKYAYNPQTRTGEGLLTQIIGLVAGALPFVDEPPAPSTPGAATLGSAFLTPPLIVPGGTLKFAVEKSIDHAFSGASITPVKTITGLSEAIASSFTSRNPIDEAQKFCGINWRWLAVNIQEQIVTIDGDPSTKPTTFTRSLGEVEWEPDLDNIYFAAEKVVVTGSMEVPDPQQDCPLAQPNPNLDNKGRPKIQRTEEVQPLSKVFPSAGNSTTPIVSQVKTIAYQYPDDDTLGTPPGLIPVQLLFETQTATTPKFSSPYQVITIYEQPAGRIFESLGTNTTLNVAKIEIQNDLFKASYIPAGLIDNSLGANFNLVLEKKEILTTKPLDPNYNHGGPIEPSTGQPGCLEPLPKQEERQPAPANPLKTIPTRGIANVDPAGWQPIRDDLYVVDVGFLPQALANPLAQKIAEREQRRRDAVQVTLPIPDEWLAAGCPLLAKCRVHDGDFQIDAPIISIADGEAKFSFSGGRINRVVAGGVPVPLFSPRQKIAARSRPICTVTSRTLPPAANSSVRGKTRSICTVTSVPVAATASVECFATPVCEVTSQIAARAQVSGIARPVCMVTSQVVIPGGFAIEGEDNGIAFAIEGEANGQTFVIEGE